MKNLIQTNEKIENAMFTTVVDSELYDMLKGAFEHISYLDDVIKEQEEVIAELTNKLNLYEE